MYKVYKCQKVGNASTLQGNLIVGAETSLAIFTAGTRYTKKVEHASNFIQALATKLQTAFVDLVCWGVDKGKEGLDIKHRSKFKILLGDDKKTT